VRQSRKLPKRFSPLIFGVIQSCITSAVAAGISHASDPAALFLGRWATTWLLSWMMMVPIVLLAAPGIRRVVERLTSEP
jgi:hypothetical protein